MSPLLGSVATILLVTLLGWALTRFRVVTEEQWAGFERVSYQVFFPAIIIHSLVTVDLSTVPALRFGGAFLAAVITVGAALLALRPWLASTLRLTDAAFSSVMQGAIRWNTFMAVSLAGLAYGAKGLTLVAVGLIAIVPLMNLWSVIMLQRFGDGQGGSLGMAGLLQNPFIWSSIVGIALNITGLPLPAPLLAAVDMFGKAALAAGLLLVGSGLRLRDLGRPTPAVLFTSAGKLLVVPIIAGLIGAALGLSGVDLSVLLICASMPCAGAAYIMARQMGGDAPLMAAIITFEAIASIATIPFIQYLFSLAR